jgi:hypothetical protein
MGWLLKLVQQILTIVTRNERKADLLHEDHLAIYEQIKSLRAEQLDQHEKEMAALQEIKQLVTIPEAVTLLFTVVDPDTNEEGEPITMYTKAMDGKPKVLRILPTDAHGNKTKLDGAATFTSSDESVLTVTNNEDGESCTFVETDAAQLDATAQILVKGDADRGEGVREISGIFDLNFGAGDAATLGFAVEDVPVATV